MKNKIFTALTFFFILFNNVKGQSLITNNKELNMKSHTENAELLKRNLEETFASEIKEAELLIDNVIKNLIPASDLKEVKQYRTSFKKVRDEYWKDSFYAIELSKEDSLKKEDFFNRIRSIRSPEDKHFSFKKKGRDVKIELSPFGNGNGTIRYIEWNNTIDTLFSELTATSDGELRAYTKREQNKKISISIANGGITRTETEGGSHNKRVGNFYPNGKIESAGESYSNDVWAIGIWYFYDENGNLIKIDERDSDDSLFEFTRADVISYLKKEGLINNENNIHKFWKIPQITVNGEITQKVQWCIQLVKNMNILAIRLDGKTGEKLHESLGRIEK